MIKRYVRKLMQKFGYDIVKTSNYEYGKEFKSVSSDNRFDFYKTPIGNYYLPKETYSDVVANSIRIGNVFDEAILNIAKPYIKEGSIILDIGANYGQMAIEYSKLGKDVTVYAFEAQKLVFEILQKNIEANRANNVKPFYNAVYDVDNIQFNFPVPDLVKFSSYGSYGLDLKSQSGIPVTSITIDSINFDRPISFMKIDIQGSDLAAMRGAIKTIKQHQMPIIFEYEEQFQEEFNTSFQEYVDFVNLIGYKFVKTVQDINYLIIPR